MPPVIRRRGSRGGAYDIRLRNAAAGTSNPGRIWVTSTGGGVAGPFTVANG